MIGAWKRAPLDPSYPSTPVLFLAAVIIASPTSSGGGPQQESLAGRAKRKGPAILRPPGPSIYYPLRQPRVKPALPGYGLLEKFPNTIFASVTSAP